MKRLLVLLFVAAFMTGARADRPLPKDARIRLNGYVLLNGVYRFQFFFMGLPAAQQPGFLKTGDALGYGGYTVGPFHPVTPMKWENPVTHLSKTVNLSTVDLIKADGKTHVTLSYDHSSINFGVVDLSK